MFNLFLKTFATLNKMSAFAYIIEIYCVHKIMNRQQLDYKQYSKIQQEIDHVVSVVAHSSFATSFSLSFKPHIPSLLYRTIGRRTFNLLRRTKHILKYQSKVVKLLDIRNFMTEHTRLPPLSVPILLHSYNTYCGGGGVICYFCWFAVRWQSCKSCGWREWSFPTKDSAPSPPP